MSFTNDASKVATFAAQNPQHPVNGGITWLLALNLPHLELGIEGSDDKIQMWQGAQSGVRSGTLVLKGEFVKIGKDFIGKLSVMSGKMYLSTTDCSQMHAEGTKIQQPA